MKKIIFLEYIGKQVCLICSMILIVVRILDWFNPYMDFMGHLSFISCARAPLALGCMGYSAE